MKILITGAGYLGLAIIRELSKTNNEVYVFVRKNDLRIPENVIQIKADLLNGQIPEITDPFDICINVVGIIREDVKTGQTFSNIYEEYPKRLIEFLKKNGTKKIIQISANGVSEVSRSKYFQGKWKSESIIKESGILYTIIRPSFIFSKKDISINFFGKIIKSFHVFPIFEKGERKLRPIYLGDLVEVIIRCIQGDTDGHIYEIGGPEEFTYKEFFNLIAKKLNTNVFLIPFSTSFAGLTLKILGDRSFLPLTYDQFLMLCMDNTTRLDFARHLNIKLHKFSEMYPDYKEENTK